MQGFFYVRGFQRAEMICGGGFHRTGRPSVGISSDRGERRWRISSDRETVGGNFIGQGDCRWEFHRTETISGRDKNAPAYHSRKRKQDLYKNRERKCKMKEKLEKIRAKALEELSQMEGGEASAALEKLNDIRVNILGK